ncbi:MAG: hypothetical protein HKN47_28755 [Pirellulaceae bacterium]|nr:hypothetical protein [Pirellulaceae bacterium]
MKSELGMLFGATSCGSGVCDNGSSVTVAADCAATETGVDPGTSELTSSPRGVPVVVAIVTSLGNVTLGWVIDQGVDTIGSRLLVGTLAPF